MCPAHHLERAAPPVRNAEITMREIYDRWWSWDPENDRDYELGTTADRNAQSAALVAKRPIVDALTVLVCHIRTGDRMLQKVHTRAFGTDGRVDWNGLPCAPRQDVRYHITRMPSSVTRKDIPVEPIDNNAGTTKVTRPPSRHTWVCRWVSGRLCRTLPRGRLHLPSVTSAVHRGPPSCLAAFGCRLGLRRDAAGG